MKVYKGFTASPGLVLGQVSRLDRPPLVFGEGPFHPEQEKQALEDAIKVAQQELDEMAGRAAPSEQAIFLFQSMMLEDEGFMNEVAFQIKAGVGAAEAMDRVGRRYAAQLAAMKDNAYMQLRSVDILDVTQRITNILCHRLRSWLALDHPVILASDLLMPTDLFSVPAGRILGLITAEGSGQSHAAIIARSLNIPGITQVGEEFLKDCDGREVILNATEGECILDPDAAARQSAITCICEMQRQNEELNAQLELPNHGRAGAVSVLHLLPRRRQGQDGDGAHLRLRCRPHHGRRLSGRPVLQAGPAGHPQQPAQSAPDGSSDLRPHACRRKRPAAGHVPHGDRH